MDEFTGMSRSSKEFFEMAERIAEFVNDSFDVKVKTIENLNESDDRRLMEITFTNRKRLLIAIKYDDFKKNFNAICSYIEKNLI